MDKVKFIESRRHHTHFCDYFKSHCLRTPKKSIYHSQLLTRPLFSVVPYRVKIAGQIITIFSNNLCLLYYMLIN